MTESTWSTAAIGFGGNVGDVPASFECALESFVPTRTRIRALSSLYRSAPWGVKQQPAFWNAAALVETIETPDELLESLRRLEDAQGREREERWGPRTLDLDLLWYSDRVSNEPHLVLPHPRLHERSFVLEPLGEIAPDWIHPLLGAKVSTLRERLRPTDQWTMCERVQEPWEISCPISR